MRGDPLPQEFCIARVGDALTDAEQDAQPEEMIADRGFGAASRRPLTPPAGRFAHSGDRSALTVAARPMRNHRSVLILLIRR